ncbi:hypothetical protein Avbf_09255 [Armadillidium vulgare]|nr:hypothetical protein Avbf_09255 [Armadillidium vulgare]
MGLWEFCFDGYRHFDLQYDKKFDGCDHVFSFEYQQIREWLLPSWLMATQAFMSIALVTIITALVTLSLLLIRWPLKTVMKHEWKMIGFCFWCQAVTSVSVLLAIIVFGSMCWSRSWLLYPNFNYLSWSYIFAVICCGFEIISGAMLLHEMYMAKERKREAMNLLQMQPQNNYGPMPVPLNFDVHSNQGYI